MCGLEEATNYTTSFFLLCFVNPLLGEQASSGFIVKNVNQSF